MHELTFVNNVIGWINNLLDKRLDLPFAQAQMEESRKRGRKRRDITIYGRDGNIALTGEVKLPEAPDGQTPYNEGVVIDAHEKADASGVSYFFTWNVNRLVLWKTFEPGIPLIQRDQRPFEVTRIRHSDETKHGHIEARLKEFLEEFLAYYADIYRGYIALPVKPLDERFIDMLDTALETIVFHTSDTLYHLYQTDLSYRDQLVRWMVSEMSWTHSEETLINDLDRAVRVSCYRLVNKLMFYNALRRRFDGLPAIRPSPHLRNGEALREELERHFQQAIVASGDYETVYLKDFADGIPYLSPIALGGWLNLIEHIEAYDFTRLDYDIVGRVFERLISPEERHRYGQHYTMPDLVDVIDGFCIRRPDAVVMDPACGGGTFLVRAYARKRYLSRGRLSHTQLLDQLYGIDVSPFAAHLALINLAVRDLDSEPNYPLIAVDDFFKVRRGFAIEVPGARTVRVVDLSQRPVRRASIETVDAVVGNPPYIRQELIDQVFEITSPQDNRIRYKEFLQRLFEAEWGKHIARLDARSDIHVYFWPHAATFLPEGGYLGLLTSSGWLDDVYGFRLQEFILQNFQVIAVLESVVEPWFTEARINTAATILRRTDDARARMDNPVRFVHLRRKLSEILPQTEDELERQQAVDALVAELEGITQNTKDDRWRIRVVNQGELALAGWEFPDDVDRPTDWDGQWQSLKALGGNYVGTKWGIYLRAPDLFFDLIDVFAGRLAPLRETAMVRRGITSGADKFFFVTDVTDELGDEQLERAYGLHRTDTARLRAIRSGDGSAHLIEAEYLAPLVFSVMELDGPAINVSQLSRKVVLVDGSPEDLKGTQVLRYIQYGEGEGYHKRPTCAGRTIRDRNGKIIRHWYELRDDIEIGAVLWPKAHQYRHIAAINQHRLVSNCRLYSISAKYEADPLVVGAILNSTLVAWFKEIYGRVVGREGNTDTMVIDAQMMPVPDIRLITPEVGLRLVTAIERLIQRPTLPIYPMGDELEQADRVGLDDAVFEALGVTDPDERCRWRERVYEELKRLYKRKRELEEIAMRNRIRAARKSRTASARTLAKEIWREFDKTNLRRFPEDFVLPGTPRKTLRLPEGEVIVGRQLFTFEGVLGVGHIQVGDTAIDVGSLPRAEFIKAWQEAGNTSEVQVPESDEMCQQVLDAYRQYRAEVEEQLATWAASRTPDERLQWQVINLLWKHIGEYLQAA